MKDNCKKSFHPQKAMPEAMQLNLDTWDDLRLHACQERRIQDGATKHGFLE
jgi:hypothetical protein